MHGIQDAQRHLTSRRLAIGCATAQNAAQIRRIVPSQRQFFGADTPEKICADPNCARILLGMPLNETAHLKFCTLPDGKFCESHSDYVCFHVHACSRAIIYSSVLQFTCHLNFSDRIETKIGNYYTDHEAIYLILHIFNFIFPILD